MKLFILMILEIYRVVFIGVWPYVLTTLYIYEMKIYTIYHYFRGSFCDLKINLGRTKNKCFDIFMKFGIMTKYIRRTFVYSVIDLENDSLSFVWFQAIKKFG